MSIKYEQNAILLAKCIHHTTNIPIALFHNNDIVFCQPKHIESCASILHDDSLIPNNQPDEHAIQHFENKFGEISLTYNLKDNYHVFIGPMIKESVSSGTLTNLVRKGEIPFHKKTALQNYYSSCPIANEEKVFYLEKLIETVFSSSNTASVSNDETSEGKYTGSIDFIQQKNEYRNDSFLHTPYAIEQNISRTISSGDTETAKRILVEMNIRPHAKLASSSLRSYKNSMICSCSFMTRAAIAGGVNPDDAFTLSDAYINTIEEFQTIKELESFESKMVEGFTEKVNNIKLNKDDISYNVELVKDSAESTLFKVEMEIPKEVIQQGGEGIKYYCENKSREIALNTEISADYGVYKMLPSEEQLLKYTGEEQELITAGGSDTGTVMYRLGDEGDYSIDIPKAKNAGTYRATFTLKDGCVWSNGTFDPITLEWIIEKLLENPEDAKKLPRRDAGAQRRRAKKGLN